MATESSNQHKYNIVDPNNGREDWVVKEEAKSRVRDPEVGAEIGGFVMGSFGPAWDITPSEIQEIKGDTDQNDRPAVA